MDQQQTVCTHGYALEKYNLYKKMAELYRQQYEAYTAILTVYEQQRQYIRQPVAAEVVESLHEQHKRLSQQIRALRAELIQLRRRSAASKPDVPER